MKIYEILNNLLISPIKSANLLEQKIKNIIISNTKFSSLKEKAVDSTWITDLTYNRPNKVLTMRLSNGRTYSIDGITRTMFDAWIKSNSKGKYYHDKIKNTYRAKRIK